MKTLNVIALALVIIGGLNWGLIGLFDFNLVTALFGVETILADIVYVIIGLASVYALYLFKPVMETPRGYDTRHEIHTS